MHSPWYKQFWPWFLIAIPLASFGMGFLILHLATNTTDSLVVDDYYKEGKVINARLDKIEQARKKGIKTTLLINDGSIALTFTSGMPRDGQALKLSFYHVTLKARDVSLLLSQDAKGVYRGFTEAPLDGKWKISVMPVDESWKIQQTVTLPHSGEFIFNP
ncbi:FixH family protein [Alteromonas sp. ASW11-130]|uniref:FixH family protein n=1 Tax=Alteromonas sp. ASW11-130 TaxID=3015775 RepID=UPI0022423E42|nr:FixH family protein [Alteromonas sp. ASW11-130]MCW8092367.1 FixH family protein [Alteromonas sp. ASW11-130]